MKNKHKPYGPYEKYFKRPIDLVCGLAAVTILAISIELGLALLIAI